MNKALGLDPYSNTGRVIIASSEVFTLVSGTNAYYGGWKSVDVTRNATTAAALGLTIAYASTPLTVGITRAGVAAGENPVMTAAKSAAAGASAVTTTTAGMNALIQKKPALDDNKITDAANDSIKE